MNRRILLLVFVQTFIFIKLFFSNYVVLNIGQNINLDDSSKIFLDKLIGDWEGRSEWSKSIMFKNEIAIVNFSCVISSETENIYEISFKSSYKGYTKSGFFDFKTDKGLGGWMSPVIDENSFSIFFLNCDYENGSLYINKQKSEMTIGNNSKLIYSAILHFEKENMLVVEWDFNFSGVPFNSFDNKKVEISYKGKDIFYKILK